MVYLVSSLPSLTFGQVPPISIDEFNNHSRSQLSERQFNILDSIDIRKTENQKNGNQSVALLIEEVFHDISEIRSAKAQNRQPALIRVPNRVVSGNPLQREEQILKWQWEELDNIESGQTFTLTVILVYKLRLQILTRLNSFDKVKGAEVLASVVNPAKNKEEK